MANPWLERVPDASPQILVGGFKQLCNDPLRSGLESVVDRTNDVVALQRPERTSSRSSRQSQPDPRPECSAFDCANVRK